jgi:ubiquinone/menaquinone biosynthesis C-methylase UbiE
VKSELREIEAELEARYSKRASEYDRGHFCSSKDRYWHFVEIAALSRGLGIASGVRVLDVAGGTGALSIALASLGAEVELVDISAPMIEQAEQEARRRDVRLSSRIASASALPFPDGTFDCVFSTRFLHNVPKAVHATYLREMARVTKPGGIVLVEVVNALAGFGLCPLRRALKRLRGMHNVPWYWPGDAVRLVSDCGLRVRTADGIGLALPFTDLLVTRYRRVGDCLVRAVGRTPWAFLASKAFLFCEKE